MSAALDSSKSREQKWLPRRHSLYMNSDDHTMPTIEASIPEANSESARLREAELLQKCFLRPRSTSAPEVQVAGAMASLLQKDGNVSAEDVKARGLKCWAALRKALITEPPPPESNWDSLLYALKSTATASPGQAARCLEEALESLKPPPPPPKPSFHQLLNGMEQDLRMQRGGTDATVETFDEEEEEHPAANEEEEGPSLSPSHDFASFRAFIHTGLRRGSTNLDPGETADPHQENVSPSAPSLSMQPPMAPAEQHYVPKFRMRSNSL